MNHSVQNQKIKDKGTTLYQYKSHIKTESPAPGQETTRRILVKGIFIVPGENCHHVSAVHSIDPEA